MSEEIQTTGTTADGDAKATGTTAGGDAEDPKVLQQRIEDLENFKAKALAEKSNAEATKRELEAMKMQQAAAMAQTPPNATMDPRLVALQQANSQLEYLASQNDPGAIWQLAMKQEIVRQNQENLRLKELMSVPDTRRDQVEKLSQQYGVTPKAAELMLDGMEYRQAKDKVREGEERERKDAPRPIHTATVGVPAAEVNKTIFKGSEYAALVAKLSEDGKLAEISVLRRKREKGEIQVL